MKIMMAANLAVFAWLLDYKIAAILWVLATGLEVGSWLERRI